jgi:dihydrofolate reductase
MEADAIDEYRLVLCPVVLGSGRPLFREDANVQLKLVKATVMDLGAVSLVYARR